MAEESFRRTFRNPTLIRSSSDGLCGLHSIQHSVRAQAPHLPIPSFEELLAQVGKFHNEFSKREYHAVPSIANDLNQRSWFFQDQLGAMFYHWGRKRGVDVALGIWTQGIFYQIHDGPDNEFPTIVWICHNGHEHYEGLRDANQIGQPTRGRSVGHKRQQISWETQQNQNPWSVQPSARSIQHLSPSPLELPQTRTTKRKRDSNDDDKDYNSRRGGPGPPARTTGGSSKGMGAPSKGMGGASANPSETQPETNRSTHNEPGVFLSTQREYPAEFRHLNCHSSSSHHSKNTKTVCAWPTPVKINEDPRRLEYQREMEVCQGNCNEYEYQNDQLEANIATGLQGRAQTFYDSAHPNRSRDAEIVGTRIIWSEDSVPTYFSTRHKTKQPHSGAITPGHLALIQARGNIDKIQLDFQTSNRKFKETPEKSKQKIEKIFDILRRPDHRSNISKGDRSEPERGMPALRGSGASKVTLALSLAVATVLGFLGTKKISDTKSLLHYNN
ncbi:hypothetical protein O1611_g2819 [Lasiodiplodia mahajangana]|uniref:Uncharacterized protein n=1 Tax=Lasiodiplodia mahajangana TaxID=1108764 RepID=A0ACC2JU00_9PEZI|nr:hypothetical protein O1611_g2819 [Lasiodiplodia mahajangana]